MSQNVRFLVQTTMSWWDAEYTQIISPCVVPTIMHGGGGVMVWGCFAGDTVSDLFRIQGTLNQHGYHSTLQGYAIPSGLLLVGLSFFNKTMTQVTPPGCVKVIWPRRRVMVLHQMTWPPQSPWPQPYWDGLGWVGPQSEGKANKCSAYVGTPLRLLVKHSRWN